MEIISKISNPDWWTEQIFNDLYFFCRNVVASVEDPTPGYKDLYAPTHKRLCRFLQTYAIPGNMVIILLPRGWLKSCVGTIGFGLWKLLHWWREGARTYSIISNATIGNAKEFLWKYKYNLQYNDFLRGLFREYIPDDPEKESERWTQDEIQIRGCRIETGSVEGNLVSRHYNGIMFNDDLVNRENSATKDQLEKTKDWWRLSQSLKMPQGIEVVPGTRWHYDDLYGLIIERFLKITRKEWDELIRQPIFEYHRGPYHLIQGSCWADYEAKTGSTFPVLFPEKKLKQIMEEQQELAGGQYLNDPIAMADSEFKRRWFKNYHPHEVPAVRNPIMLVDPSGKDTKDSDRSAIVNIYAGSDKKIYIYSATSRKSTDSQLAERIILEACNFQPTMIGIEEYKLETIHDLIEMLIPQMIRRGEIHKDHARYAVTIPGILSPLQPGGRSKYSRIRNLTGWVEQGKMLFALEGMDDLQDELLRHPKSRKDDIADALAYALDVVFPFPRPDDPAFGDLVPPDLRKSQRQKEEEEWDNYRQECDDMGTDGTLFLEELDY